MILSVVAASPTLHTNEYVAILMHFINFILILMIFRVAAPGGQAGGRAGGQASNRTKT